ncbi:MAG: PfkB family carbohydrate kinase [Eubacteriales bacterium]|nr:PfkB family carbohydrate kinase [Eubacteriales bacterium]
MIDVTALGELLIDFTPAGLSNQGNPIFEQNPGGAPANVLAALSKLGCQTAFIGKVGTDQFGQFLKKTLEDGGVSTHGLVMTDTCNTTLAFVHLSPTGDRSFSFYRDPGADLLLEPAELAYQLIEDCRIFHFGSVSMTAEPSRSATIAAVKHAKEQHNLISYDPNLRLRLWKSPEAAKEGILSVMHLADLVKISEEELVFLTGESDLNKGAHYLIDHYGLKLVLITLGPGGAYACNSKGSGRRPTYQVKVVDTTGAGDAFTGGFLYKLLQSGKAPDELTADDLDDFLDFANAVGSIATTKKGAIPALPDHAAIEALRAKQEFETV